MQDEEFNIDELRIEEKPIETGRPASKLRRQRQDMFVKVPVEWMYRLSGARTTAAASVALHLLFRAFQERQQTVKLANRLLTSRGISRCQKWRALAELETLGLISVERRPRKSPIITLLYPAQEA